MLTELAFTPYLLLSSLRPLTCVDLKRSRSKQLKLQLPQHPAPFTLTPTGRTLSVTYFWLLIVQDDTQHEEHLSHNASPMDTVMDPPTESTTLATPAWKDVELSDPLT